MSPILSEFKFAESIDKLKNQKSFNVRNGAPKAPFPIN